MLIMFGYNSSYCSFLSFKLIFRFCSVENPMIQYLNIYLFAYCYAIIILLISNIIYGYLLLYLY
ncbi:hypothetical protein BGW37DRAFT_510198 [Umbelopsis sp. PMI_123]|nr:hypothetical protein BGW37DRAFT_510198 [Umbelopsis sp. PMI_123]